MRQTKQVQVTGHGLRVSGHAAMRRAECGASVMLRAPLASDWEPAPLASGSGPAQDGSVAQVRRHHRPHARCHSWDALTGYHCHLELRVFAGTCPASSSPSSPAARMRCGVRGSGRKAPAGRDQRGWGNVEHAGERHQLPVHSTILCRRREEAREAVSRLLERTA